MRSRRRYGFALFAVLAALLAVAAAGCGGGDTAAEPAAPAEPAPPPAEPPPADTAAPAESAPPAETTEALSGSIEVDGSSTVGPLVQAAAETFQQENPDVKVTVGISGTGGGFERFCAGETDISNASRPIKEDEEAPLCADNGVEYVELQVAVDAITVVTNKENDFATCLTVDQLHTMWAPEAEGKIDNWNQIDPSFPDEELELSGPGTDSGTFDYFTGEINGEEGASRADYNASEDDNVIVTAVEGAPGALGYFGYTYYEQNQDKLNAAEIDGGSGCVAPSAESAQDGTYTPLSRPLFIYVKKESLARPEVAAFVQYILDDNAEITEAALFIPPHEEDLQTSKDTLAAALGS
jgi:phosphate transport system substrate-binding protein